MRVRGYTEETVVIVKEVEVEVPDDADDSDIHTAIRDACYRSPFKGDNGWQLANSLNVDVNWVKYVKCHFCGKDRLEDDGACEHCGTNPPCCPA